MGPFTTACVVVGVRGVGVGGGEGVEAEVDGGGSTPIVVSTLFFLKEQFKELSSPTCCYGYIFCVIQLF